MELLQKGPKKKTVEFFDCKGGEGKHRRATRAGSLPSAAVTLSLKITIWDEKHLCVGKTE